MRPTEKLRRAIALATIGLCAFAVTTACTGGSADGKLEGDGGAPRLSGALTSFDSCDEALTELQDKALSHLEADGFRGYGAEEKAQAESDPGSSEGKAPEPGTKHSGTNVQEEGVDEPDVVKTDGDRIISIADGRLYVVDAEAEEITGSVTIGDGTGNGSQTQLLLHGDRVLVISPYSTGRIPQEWKDGDNPVSSATSLSLVDISGEDPKVVNDYTIEGTFLDARAVEEMSRIVVASQPRLPYEKPGVFESYEGAVADAIEDSEIEDWLPRYAVDDETGQVPCRALARPTEYTASSMMTILSFDMTGELDDGNPLSIEADGETVYGTGNALYVANNQNDVDEDGSSKNVTELYRFGIGEGASVRFESSGKVPGHVLNQYSMSEWDGHLRIATTEDQRSGEEGNGAIEPTNSVYVLKVGDESLKRAGKVRHLGQGERIKSVRFIEDKGYVVTFRETDPLYTIDLSNPQEPEEVGELKIPGYSAYLHPVSGDRLVGVGKAGTDSGTITGAQVSLFDISDDRDPKQVDTYSVDGASSEVEYDPHAFLYWPDKQMVVIPVSANDGTGSTMLVLDIAEGELNKRGTIRHDESTRYQSVGRTIVIGNTLWTISAAGMMASDIDSLEQREWISYG